MKAQIIKYCSTEPKTSQQIMWHLGYDKTQRSMQTELKKLVEQGNLARETIYYFAGR